MTQPIDLAALPVGARIQHPLLVLDVERREAASGPFTTLVLGNATGRLPTAPFWAEEQDKVAGLAKGAVAQVIAEVGTYGGRRQLKVTSIRPLPRGSVPWAELLPSAGDPGRYWDTLDRWRTELAAPRLRAAVDLVFADDAFRARFETCPAALQGHHAELGGLLRHTVEVAAIGRQMAKVMRADADLVTAGALLHDIGKVDAYRWDGAFEHTEAGALLGHVALGLLRFERAYRAASAPACTEEEFVLLQHYIASHHGVLEYGATARPMTLEAELLHYADNASAKGASMQDALRDPDAFEGDAALSARPLWYLDRRRVYRGRPDFGRA